MSFNSDCTQHAIQLIDDLVDANDWKLADLVTAIQLLARQEKILLTQKLNVLIHNCK